MINRVMMALDHCLVTVWTWHQTAMEVGVAVVLNSTGIWVEVCRWVAGILWTSVVRLLVISCIACITRIVVHLSN